MYEEDTIAAIATAPGEGGVAIVRVSGADAENIAARIFVRPDGKNGGLKSHRLYHGKICDPESKRVLDEVLLTIMRNPRSYTGEDVVEIHGHGGAFISRRILGLVLAQGARQAERGEFTKRAFLNGRLDLTQAEGVLDLIRAQTDKGADLALHQAGGELSKWVGDLREDLLEIVVQVEAAIDFPDEEIELLQRSALVQKIERLCVQISDILATYDWGRLFRDGVKVCICGRPNVGKSSLLNALLGTERVIVTPVPGTTRDVIEESIDLNGLRTVLWDTAGIRETDEQVESIGVQRSREHLEKADAAIFVVDGSAPLSSEDRALFGKIASKKRKLMAINKRDLPQDNTVLEELRKLHDPTELVFVSAQRGDGIQALKVKLREMILDTDEEPSIVITNLRHKSALMRGNEALKRALVSLDERRAAELLAVDLNGACAALEEIIGMVHMDDILEHIFSEFCIGK